MILKLDKMSWGEFHAGDMLILKEGFYNSYDKYGKGIGSDLGGSNQTYIVKEYSSRDSTIVRVQNFLGKKEIPIDRSRIAVHTPLRLNEGSLSNVGEKRVFSEESYLSPTKIKRSNTDSSVISASKKKEITSSISISSFKSSNRDGKIEGVEESEWKWVDMKEKGNEQKEDKDDKDKEGKEEDEEEDVYRLPVVSKKNSKPKEHGQVHEAFALHLAQFVTQEYDH